MLWLLPWQLSCVVVLFATATSAQIVAADSNIAGIVFQGSIKLQELQGVDKHDVTDLVPLTRRAVAADAPALEGNLVRTNESTLNGLSRQDISYISCQGGDYSQGSGAYAVLQEAMQHNISAVILYSTTSNFCGFSPEPKEPLTDFPIFSMTNRDSSATVLDNVDDIVAAKKYFIAIARSGGGEQNGNGTTPNPNPLGPSPSTAVAMIILYSITGIITALFLVIIITGAVRAHRHPDRYGPRDVLGRPRQSRARGLGRAILDTIPIVKFGEREQPSKPTDVELGSTSSARDASDNANTNSPNPDAVAQTTQPGTEPTSAAPGPEAPQDIVADADEQSGIAPAQPLAAIVAAQESAGDDDHLGCSICTEDFEKGQDIRVLPCDHKFHPECVDPWLLNVSGTCPLCRVDLRPTTSRTTAGDDADEQDPDMLAPPLQPETDASHRRRSALRPLLMFRTQPNASPEERISALRRLREARRNDENAGQRDVATVRRSRRMSARLSDVFSSRTRRVQEHDEPTTTEAVTAADGERGPGSGSTHDSPR